jgi:hypothetical protein
MIGCNSTTGAGKGLWHLCAESGSQRARGRADQSRRYKFVAVGYATEVLVAWSVSKGESACPHVAKVPDETQC